MLHNMIFQSNFKASNFPLLKSRMCGFVRRIQRRKILIYWLSDVFIDQLTSMDKLNEQNRYHKFVPFYLACICRTLVSSHRSETVLGTFPPSDAGLLIQLWKYMNRVLLSLYHYLFSIVNYSSCLKWQFSHVTCYCSEFKSPAKW